MSLPFGSVKKKDSKNQPDATSLAFGVVTLIAFLVSFNITRLSLPLLLLWIGLGIVFTYTGIFIWQRILDQPSAARWAAYFAFQLLLATLIYLIGQGNSWLVFMPLISHAVVALSLPLASLLSLYAILVIAFPYLSSGQWDAVLTVSLSVGAAVIFIALFTRITVSEERSRIEIERLASELGEANNKLRQYAARVEELAIAEERNRLAREIHDGLGHYLTAIHMQLKATRAVIDQDPQQAGRSLERAEQLAGEALADVRRSVSALRSSPLASRPLTEALQALVGESQAAGIQSRLEVLGEHRILPAKVELALYRAAQEGLTNVRKHAQASQAQLILDYTASDRVSMSLQDDGVGTAAAPGGFGLMGVQERVHLLDGQMQVQTAPGQGFRLWLEIPLDPLEADPLEADEPDGA